MTDSRVVFRAVMAEWSLVYVSNKSDYSVR